MIASLLHSRHRSVLLTTNILLSALCILHNGASGTTDKCSVDGLGDGPPFPSTNISHLPFSTEIGYQVLMPDFKFNCYGNITKWSALFAHSTGDTLHKIWFQVWRPMCNGRYYQIVGEDLIEAVTNPDDAIVYHSITEEQEGENGDGKFIFFQPNDILGFFVGKSFGVSRYFHPTYQIETDDDELAIDMYIREMTCNSDCEMLTTEYLENNTYTISAIPNIHFIYDMLEADNPVFQTQNEDCSTMEHTPLPTATQFHPHTSSSATPSSSIMVSTTTPIPSSDPSTEPTDPSTEPTIAESTGTLLPIIATASGGGLVILMLGSLFIVIVALLCKKKSSDKRSPRQATNTLYSDMNGVDEPTAYATTLRLKPGTYLDVERGTANSTPHFSIRTEGSTASLLSNHGRPSLPQVSAASGSVRGGPADMRQILLPGDVGAVSMQLPRSSAQEAHWGHGRKGSSLREVFNHTRPPIPSEMRDSRNGSRRVLVPLKERKDSRQMQHTGKSMPAIQTSQPPLPCPPTPQITDSPAPYLTHKSTPAVQAHSLSPPPLPCPPTPQIDDPPVPYLTPEKPWYYSDYEITRDTVDAVLPEGEELYVPTMEERNSIGEDYSRLVQPHHSKICNTMPDKYSEPASSTYEIYQQLSNWRTREIIRKYITIQDQIGSGHFATVHHGVWQRPGGEIEIAVKVLKNSAGERDRVKFLQEAAIMGQFNHTNVVKLHGMVTLDEPILIVMELMPNGDLNNYLGNFTDPKYSPSSTPPPSPRTPLIVPPSLPAQLLSFCRQVADGMDYLSRKNFVHRDLATRNIFLTKDFSCKIGDFGLARDLGVEDLYQSRGGKIPIKWTAPEALQYRQYTSASDVWSYGMVLFEIWSLGHRPYDVYIEEKDVVELIEGSVCQPPPPGCPRELYKLMIHCWHSNPSDRPSFAHICEFFNQSDSVLLCLPEELPQSVSQKALQLGAPLSEARGLYLDLQNCYDESVV